MRYCKISHVLCNTTPLQQWWVLKPVQPKDHCGRAKKIVLPFHVTYPTTKTFVFLPLTFWLPRKWVIESNRVQVPEIHVRENAPNLG
jgi:hypothetical protein